jgi:protein TonB
LSDGTGSSARAVASVDGRAWIAEEGLVDGPLRGPQKPILSAVLEHGERNVYIGLAFGCVITLIIHGIASFRAETALFEMLHWVHDTEKDMKDYFWASYDIEPPKADDKKEDPPPEAPPPPEVKEIAPTQQQPVVKPEDPYKDAPPPTKIAEAAPLLTAPGEDPYGVATGNNANATGLQAGGGTETHGDATRPGAVPEAKVSAGPVAAAPPKEDRSRPPTIAGGLAWSCPFPPEADADGRDTAVATIVVTVSPDGTPASVSIVADPGSGFGRAARQCAFGRRYQPGLDRDGAPTKATTPPIRVRFSR